jgi:hypothetical protein
MHRARLDAEAVAQVAKRLGRATDGEGRQTRFSRRSHPPARDLPHPSRHSLETGHLRLLQHRRRHFAKTRPATGQRRQAACLHRPIASPHAHCEVWRVRVVGVDRRYHAQLTDARGILHNHTRPCNQTRRSAATIHTVLHTVLLGPPLQPRLSPWPQRRHGRLPDFRPRIRRPRETDQAGGNVGRREDATRPRHGRQPRLRSLRRRRRSQQRPQPVCHLGRERPAGGGGGVHVRKRR